MRIHAGLAGIYTLPLLLLPLDVGAEQWWRDGSGRLLPTNFVTAVQERWPVARHPGTNGWTSQLTGDNHPMMGQRLWCDMWAATWNMTTNYLDTRYATNAVVDGLTVRDYGPWLRAAAMSPAIYTADEYVWETPGTWLTATSCVPCLETNYFVASGPKRWVSHAIFTLEDEYDMLADRQGSELPGYTLANNRLWRRIPRIGDQPWYTFGAMEYGHVHTATVTHASCRLVRPGYVSAMYETYAVTSTPTSLSYDWYIPGAVWYDTRRDYVLWSGYCEPSTNYWNARGAMVYRYTETDPGSPNYGKRMLVSDAPSFTVQGVPTWWSSTSNLLFDSGMQNWPGTIPSGWTNAYQWKTTAMPLFGQMVQTVRTDRVTGPWYGMDNAAQQVHIRLVGNPGLVLGPMRVTGLVCRWKPYTGIVDQVDGLYLKQPKNLGQPETEVVGAEETVASVSSANWTVLANRYVAVTNVFYANFTTNRYWPGVGEIIAAETNRFGVLVAYTNGLTQWGDPAGPVVVERSFDQMGGILNAMKDTETTASNAVWKARGERNMGYTNLNLTSSYAPTNRSENAPPCGFAVTTVQYANRSDATRSAGHRYSYLTITNLCPNPAATVSVYPALGNMGWGPPHYAPYSTYYHNQWWWGSVSSPNYAPCAIYSFASNATPTNIVYVYESRCDAPDADMLTPYRLTLDYFGDAASTYAEERPFTALSKGNYYAFATRAAAYGTNALLAFVPTVTNTWNTGDWTVGASASDANLSGSPTTYCFAKGGTTNTCYVPMSLESYLWPSPVAMANYCCWKTDFRTINLVRAQERSYELNVSRVVVQWDFTRK